LPKKAWKLGLSPAIGVFVVQVAIDDVWVIGVVTELAATVPFAAELVATPFLKAYPAKAP
jgi:hypothetical protein